MKKQKQATILSVIIILGLLGAVVYGSKNKSNTKEETKQSVTTTITNSQTPTFFYGNTCPHCADVEEWMETNKIEEKIVIAKKEVYENKQNALELESAAKVCNIPTDTIGVPFLFTEGKCIVGTPDIISYLSEKAGIK